RQVAVPPRGQLPALHLIDLRGKIGKLRAIVGKELLPPAARLRAALADAAVENLVHPVRDEETDILRPAISALREPHFSLAQRLAMSRGRVDLVGRAITDVTVEDDQG